MAVGFGQVSVLVQWELLAMMEFVEQLVLVQVVSVVAIVIIEVRVRFVVQRLRNGAKEQLVVMTWKKEHVRNIAGEIAQVVLGRQRIVLGKTLFLVVVVRNVILQLLHAIVLHLVVVMNVVLSDKQGV